MPRTTIPALWLAVVAAIGLSPLSALAEAEAAAKAQEADNCVYAREVEQFEILDNETLLLYGKLDKIWLNRLGNRCAGLRDNMAVYLERYGSQICANDRFSARRHGDSGPAARCRLGAFEPISKEQIPALKQALAES